MARRLELGRLQQEAAALAGAVRGVLGPRGGRALLVGPAGQALLTRDGRCLLRALGLEPPTARMMAVCACGLRAATGDGAKTFVVLLAAVLGGLRGAVTGGLRRALRIFEARVLQRAVARGLRPHLQTALRGWEVEAGALEALVEAYLGGRLGPGERRRLARLCCEWCRRCDPAAAARPLSLRLLGRRFAELHAAVPGLPVASSRVLPGLVLRRDFAAYCPAEGRLRALLVTEALQPALAAPGVEFVVDSEGRHQASLRWIARRAEAFMKRLQSNDVKLLLSSVKQEEVVIYYAELLGISLIECLSAEEVALICEITGVSPYAPFGDNGQGQITETAVATATFCQRLLLGSERCAHIGFCGVCTFQPHCLVLCGPADSVNEQHAAALQGAFTMLQQLFETVHQSEQRQAEGESQNNASQVGGWHFSGTQKQLLIENTPCDGNWVSEHQLKARNDETETQIVDTGLQGNENPTCVQTDEQIPLNPISHIKEFSVATEGDGSSDVQKRHRKCHHPGNVHENYKSDLLLDNQKSYSIGVLAAPNADLVPVCGRPGVGKDLEKSCNIVPLKGGESCASVAQNDSSALIEAGSVLPVGGYFEILLHYYIERYSKQLQQPEVTVVSSVVANALLSIPKALYGTTERNSFSEFYLKVINALRKNQPLPVNRKGLESVYGKYQLVVSVLHCVTELLSVDLIIGVKRPLQKPEDHDSEDDF